MEFQKEKCKVCGHGPLEHWRVKWMGVGLRLETIVRWTCIGECDCQEFVEEKGDGSSLHQ